MEMLPEVFWKMKDFQIIRVRMTPEPSDSDVENTYFAESCGVLLVPEEDIQHVN